MRNLGTTLTPHSYRANFCRFSKTSDNKLVALMTNVTDEQGHFLADHVWIKHNDFNLDGIPFKKGEQIHFFAEPVRYIKGIFRRQVVKKLQTDIGLRNVIFLARGCQKN